MLLWTFDDVDVVKKMLAPLRTGNYPVVQLPHYVDAMKTVVFNHFSTETVRNLATFLVSTLKQSKRHLLFLHL